MRLWIRLDSRERQHFYCRRENLVVGGCPLEPGPCHCPLSAECQARVLPRDRVAADSRSD